MSKARLHVKVYGIVQGVGFRYFAKREAKRLKLSGWVRNNADGSVEVLAEGEREALEEFLSLLQKGPTFAVVKRVDYSWESPRGEFSDFNIVY